MQKEKQPRIEAWGTYMFKEMLGKEISTNMAKKE